MFIYTVQLEQKFNQEVTKNNKLIKMLTPKYKQGTPIPFGIWGIFVNF